MNRHSLITTTYLRLNRPWTAFAIVLVATFLSRLPFLGMGYGRDPDAWRLVFSGFSIAEGAGYIASRLPGYPVPEFGYALLYLTVPKLLPAVAALSALAAGFFALIAARSGVRDAVLAGCAFALTPVVFVNSTNAMDYMWAMAFIMAAWTQLLGRRYVLAGVLLGVAVGCRMTSALMLVPFAMSMRGEPLARRLRVALTMIVVAGVLYLPGLMTYGRGVFTFVDDREGARLGHLVGEGVFGTIGLLGVLVVVVGAIIFFAMRRQRGDTSDAADTWMWSSGLVMYVVLFARLPVESGYLIPALPFALLLASRFTARGWFVAFAVLLMASPWLDVRPSGVFPGAMTQNQYVRRTYLRDSSLILRSADQLDDTPSAIVSGWLTAQLSTLRALESFPPASKDIVFVKTLEEAGDRRVYFVAVEGLYPPGQMNAWRAAGVEALPIR